MRLKFVAALILSAGLILGAAFYFKPHLEKKPGIPAGLSITNIPETSIAVADTKPFPSPAAAPVVASLPPSPLSQADIDAELERLQQLSRQNDSASLASILADLSNPEKEIRETATEAAKEFGSTNAIPALKSAADNTENVQEKIAFLEAADALSLPPLTFLEQPVSRTAEQIQADKQRHAQRHAEETLPPPVEK